MRTKQRARGRFFRSPPPTPSNAQPPPLSIHFHSPAHRCPHARTHLASPQPPLSLSLSLSPSLPLSQNGKAVVEVNGTKVLLALDGEDVRAVSNKCTHLGLSLQGKVRVQRSCARGRAG